MVAPGGVQPLPKKAEPRSASREKRADSTIPAFSALPLLEKTGIFIVIMINIFGFAVRGGTPGAAGHAWDKRSRCRSPGAAPKNSSLAPLEFISGALGVRGTLPGQHSALRPCPHPRPQKSGCTPRAVPPPAAGF